MDAVIEREVRLARAQCRTHLRTLVRETRQELGLPSVLEEENAKLKATLTNLSVQADIAGLAMRKVVHAFAAGFNTFFRDLANRQMTQHRDEFVIWFTDPLTEPLSPMEYADEPSPIFDAMVV